MRKWLVLFVAIAAVGMPLAAAAQVAPDKGAGSNAAGTEFKYQVYVGFGYTSLNQVNQSRYGLIGGDVTLSRNWGRFFAVSADGAFYPHSLASGNPGSPSVDMVLFGPEVHGAVYENWNIFGRGWIGGEHTGGEGQTPNISVAGGIGGGVEHAVRGGHWAIRASGDDIASSFSLRNNTTQLGYSPHMRFNARAGIGIAYRF